MRILFTFVGGNGHLQPLVPIARAAAAAGHTVAVAGRAAMAPTIRAAGFTAFVVGAESDGPPPRRPLLAPSAAREDRDLREGFARRVARERAAAYLALCAEWQPDLLVCDEIDFGAMIAAERLGLPQATVLVIAAGSFVRPAVVAEPLDALRAEHGLPPDPTLAMLSRYLVLSPFPAGLRDPAYPLPATAHAYRALEVADAGPSEALPWMPARPGAPTVYFTLGTIFNLESGDLFARVLAGLRELPVTIVVTVGEHIDPAELGPQPAHVHIARYIPQATILPHCDAVIAHGGSGSLLGALTHGLPSVLLPMGADQLLNAARCEALGFGRVLDPVLATSEAVRQAVATVLAEPSYRQAAARLQAEIAAQPPAARAVALLERLAAERRRDE